MTDQAADIERAIEVLEGMGMRRTESAGRIEFRRVFNYGNCSPWRKVPDLFYDTFADLQEYLSYEYSEDPRLEKDGFGACYYVDKYGLQYRNVRECPACDGGGWVFSSYQATNAPNLELCDKCGNAHQTLRP